MKNTLKLFAAIAVCAMVFAACKPENPEPAIETGLEGQFMPERKISSVEAFDRINEDSLKPNHKITYEWNGDLLYKVTETQFEGELVSIRTYQYDSLNRVSVIKFENDEIPSTYTFIYEGKELARVNQNDDNGNLIADYTIARTDGKVTEITATHWTTDATIVSSKTIVWDGDNIVQVSMTENGMSHPTNYTFDDKINPLQGLLTPGFYYDVTEVFSANNVLSSSTDLPAAGISLVISYEFEYDDNGYPVKATSSKGFGSMVISQVIQYTYME